jgi:hypothetical protein
MDDSVPEHGTLVITYGRRLIRGNLIFGFFYIGAETWRTSWPTSTLTADTLAYSKTPDLGTNYIYTSWNYTDYFGLIYTYFPKIISSFIQQVGNIIGQIVSVLNWAPHDEDTLGSGGVAPRILYVGTGLRWVVSLCRFTSGEKNSRYPLDRRLGVPQSRSGRGG